MASQQHGPKKQQYFEATLNQPAPISLATLKQPNPIGLCTEFVMMMMVIMMTTITMSCVYLETVLLCSDQTRLVHLVAGLTLKGTIESGVAVFQKSLVVNPAEA